MAVSNRLKNEQKEKQLLSSRLLLLFGLILFGASLLIIRLWSLQITQYQKYQTLSNKNQLSIIPLPPPRGLIYDRNGVVLAENMPVYSLEIIPERTQSLKKTLHNLRQLIPSIGSSDVENFYRLKSQRRRFDPIPLKFKLTPEEVARFAVDQYQYPGVNISARLIRNYPLGAIMAHVLGFVGRINQQDLSKLDRKNYRATNFIGKVGIEKFYEKALHGTVGYQQIEVDASGRTVNIANRIPALPGKDLYLTLDSKLQIAATMAMRTYQGSVVVLNPNNGEILAIVSMPSYDANLFVQGIKAVDYQKLQQDHRQPLFNRSIRGQYPPASTIKPFIALGALENNIIDTSFRVYDPGWFKLPNAAHIYRDYKRGGHGWINLTQAITVSCDTFFYKLADLMGISRIYATLSPFGFGRPTQIDMGEELGGILPNKGWKRNNKQIPWYRGDTIISGIGQGFMLATPLQLAHATAGLAMQGHLFKPHLLLKSHNTTTQAEHLMQTFEEFPVRVNDKHHWKIIAKAMQNVIKSPHGTGFRFGRDSGYSIAAKTGTAQVVSNKLHQNKKYEEIPKALRDHSLFIGYAPVEKPEVAIAVIVENDYIAPNIARKVLNAYFNTKDKQ